MHRIIHIIHSCCVHISTYTKFYRRNLAAKVNGSSKLIEICIYGAIREKSRIISSEADRLALMVGQMLDVTRIEENKILLEKKPCHIDELIYKAVETHFAILNKGENQLDIDAGLDLPQVNVDANLLFLLGWSMNSKISTKI